MIIRILVVFALACCLGAGAAWANDIALTAPSLINKDTPDAGGWDISFSVSWDNAWCDVGAACNGDAQVETANWDAAWVFAKFSKWLPATSKWDDWKHCTIAKTGNTAATGSRVAVGCSPSAACGTSDTGKGLFIYHGAAGSFTQAGGNKTSFAGAALRWLYTVDGVGPADAVKVKIFGIEMVYIPQGPFYVGDGSATGSGNFTDGSWTSGATIPVKIASEGVITIGQSAGNLWGTSTSGYNSIGGAGTLPAAFPKGYNAFYMTKYELSSGQYRDFLNALPRAAQNTRIAVQTAAYYTMSGTQFINYRSVIRNPASIPASPKLITFGVDLDGKTITSANNNTLLGNGTFNESNDGEWIAANYLEWQDLAAFADWAGLRPFTELEFEKAARGPQFPAADEYAWGSTSITQATALTHAGESGEIANAGANCNYGGTGNVYGPVRQGIFAGTATTRAAAGASYYGVMELSGSLWERPVSVGEATRGRLFTGLHGNGALNAAGNADVDYWPGNSGTGGAGGEVTGATGSGFRGGVWYDITSLARVSDRYLAAMDHGSRYIGNGARFARTSP